MIGWRIKPGNSMNAWFSISKKVRRTSSPEVQMEVRRTY